MKISREKLSYIVDSTAAPVSSIAIISTWVGFETGLIKDGLASLGLELNAYNVFLQTIPYRFYSVLALAFVLILIFTGKDYGPMYRAERRAFTTGKVVADGDTPMVSEELNNLEATVENGKWYNAVLPILSVIGITLVGLFINGGGLESGSIRDAFGNADASVVLLWAAFGGTFIAAIMGLVQRIMTIKEVADAWINGLKSMTTAGIILVLAWSLGSVNDGLGTADFIVSIAKGNVPGFLLPLIMFLIPLAIAFSTGTSWGANSIVMPLAIPLAVQIGGVDLLVPVAGAVLTGAVFGDHISPISDTTIMSSMASGSDHIAHVKTQIPYAMTVGIVSIVAGFIPAGLGVNPYISLGVSLVALFIIVKVFGKNARENSNNINKFKKVS